MPKVSVIIPTYNRGNLVARAINSVLAQTFKDLEIIVVDDASEDNTGEIIDSYDDSRIKYICHNTNRGSSAARNTGIRESKGSFIAFLDSDDEWLPQKIEKQIEKFKTSSSRVGVVYTGIYVIACGKKIREKIPFKRGTIYKDELLNDYVIGGGSSIMVRKECLKKIGGFDEALPARQDYDFSLRMSKYYEFEFIKKPMVKVYWDSNNRLTNVENRRIAGEIIIDKIAKDIIHESEYRQRLIFARQYFNLGLFCFYGGEKFPGIKYLLKSLRLDVSFLFVWEFWRPFFISLLGYNTYINLSRPLSHVKKKYQ